MFGLNDIIKFLKRLRSGPPMGKYTCIDQDIEFLINEENISYEEAYEVLSKYLDRDSYIIFQEQRGVERSVAVYNYDRFGPRLYPIAPVGIHLL